MGLGGGDRDNIGTGDDTGSGGDTGSDRDGIEGSGREGIWGSGEDHGESGDDGRVDIARSLCNLSASNHTGVGTEPGIEITQLSNVIKTISGVVVVSAADPSVSRTLLSPSTDGA
ncbi:hypothetical protein Tco_0814208 [Tanacetum coccineum]